MLSLFIAANTFLQQEKPLIHKLSKVINDFLNGLIVRFIKTFAVDDDSSTSFISIDCTKRENKKTDNDLVIGPKTRSELKNIPDYIVVEL